MRKLLIFILAMAALGAAVIFMHKEHTVTIEEAVESMMNRTTMKLYRHPYLGYAVSYPSFFEQIPDSLIHEYGCAQFRFWNEIELNLTTYIAPNLGNINIRQAMDSIAHARSATERCLSKDGFILSGPVKWGDSELSGHRYHAKYVRHQKLWLVQELTYPEQCRKAVDRLIKQIDAWQPWQNHVLPKPVAFPRRNRHTKTVYPTVPADSQKN